MTDTNWQARAACRGSSPDLFHPREKSGDNLDTARALCGRCPVQAECLAEALAVRDVNGFRAGRTGDERKRLLAKSPKAELKAGLNADIIRLGGKRWTAQAIALRLGTDDFVVYRVLKAHREAGAA